MDIQNELNKVLEFKTCKTCNESKELSKFRPVHKSCKQCNIEKDYENSLIRKKKHYQRNRESIIAHNSEYYYNKKFSLQESKLGGVLCA